jgi:hypothetical protein
MPQLEIAFCGCEVKERCINCGMCVEKNHCTCQVCRSCGITVYNTEICNVCGFCIHGCCNCRACKTCNIVTRYSDSCDNCGKCKICCTCYVCKTCTVNFRLEPKKLFCRSCGNCVEHCHCAVCNYGYPRLSETLSQEVVPGKSHFCSPNKICRTCRFCTDHCKCVLCDNCGQKYPAKNATNFHITPLFGFTDEQPCGRCLVCCRCNVRGVDLRKGKFTIFSSVFSKGEFKQNPLRRHLSVELEVDGFDSSVNSSLVNLALDRWKDGVVRDGSLSEDGFEINTNPCNGDLFLKHIKEISDGLTKIKGRINARCGLHVHVNVKGTPLLKPSGEPVKDPDGNDMFDSRTAYTHYDLRRLVLLYHRVEPAMFMLCDPARITSRYAKPCGKFYLTKHTTPKEFRKDSMVKFYRKGAALPKPQPRQMERYVSGRNASGEPIFGLRPVKTSIFKNLGHDLKENKRQKYTDVRYYALNLHSFFMRGTIEFRHKEGSIDYNDITNWALICGHVVDAASRLSEKEIKALPVTPKEALLAILPDNLKQYAERKWAAQEETIPRLRQIIDETWAGHSPETN